MVDLMSLLLYLDTETTGRLPKTCGCTQIAAIIVRDGVEINKFNIDINPYTYNRDITVSAKALEVTSKTEGDLRSYPSASISFFKFISWLNAHRGIEEYYTLVAYRAAFDIEVLEELFKDQTGDPRRLFDYFHFKHLDILQLVLFMDLYGEFKVKNNKLETMCNYYGIDIKAHDAMSDIESTRKLHKKLMANLGLPFNTIKGV